MTIKLTGSKKEMPHVKSYYAATANQKLIYEKLNSDLRAQVCVIGGGFTGLNTAINLAKKNYDVVLKKSESLEKNLLKI